MVLSVEFAQVKRLPTLCVALSVFYHNYKEQKETLKDSACITVAGLLEIWQRAATSTAHCYAVEERLLREHMKW